MTDFKAVGVIPARYGSTRFPAKMLADLCGKPLVVRTVERVRQARSLSDVLLATDDERIAEAARAENISVVLTRADHPSGTDRIAEAVSGIDADIVVNIQGDEPFMDAALIDALVERMIAEPGLEMATAATPIRDITELHAASVVKVVCSNSGHALYFSRSLIPFARDVSPETLLDQNLYLRHLGIYSYRRDFLLKLVSHPPHPLEETEKLEQLRALALGAKIAVLITDQPAPGVDTPEDLTAARKFYQARTGDNRL
ncbi:MAG: 3-deoxy-manno-octulosonate cytidylyltransferase [Verrucomicrobia bacterium]|nr:3-deoxy-manno-octulosonate cytidylyltransferase [Verrucomicrobiota bacterium]MCH8512159.1 3-deoxy-manno-octulosonate cytidylyltransferase [Kiritimatiellia bacterium]